MAESLCHLCGIKIYFHYKPRKYCVECALIAKKSLQRLINNSRYKNDIDYKNKRKIYDKKYRKIYYKNNRERLLQYNKDYHKKHFKRKRILLTDIEIKERRKECAKKSYTKRKLNGKHYTWRKIYLSNKKRKIEEVLRKRVYKALNVNKTKKSTKFENLCGCKISFLLNYLESKFSKGMSWDNYGFYGWHIDHIIPCSKFDLTDIEQQKQCFNYRNLQPIWAKENFKKSNKLDITKSQLHLSL